MNIYNIKEENFINGNNDYTESEKFYLSKENRVFKITITKGKNEIIIKYKNYKFQLNSNDLSILTKLEFNSISQAYEFIIDSFEENRIIIKDIINKKLISLLLTYDNGNNIKDNFFEMNLLYKKQNENLNKITKNEFKNIYVEFKAEINNLKNEIKALKNQLKTFNNNENKDINTKCEMDVKDITYSKDLTKDSYVFNNLDNSFCSFKSINNIYYLIYVNMYNSLISYDLIDNKKIIEIKNAHSKYITNLRHYLDKLNKRDLIMSISNNDNNIILWNVNNWECLLNFKNIIKNRDLYSACFFNVNNVNYIITSNYNWAGNSEPINLFDFNGNKIKEIKDSCDRTVFVDTYYDKTLCKNFIITGNKGFIKSYDYDENKIYHKYCDNDNKHHDSVVINNKEDIIKLIDSCKDGIIRIWNFHSGLLINKIKVRKDYNLYGLCLWNNEYLFVGCEDKTIKLIELKSGKNIRNLIGHNNRVITIKKIILPKYGECLISQGYNNDQIKLWINKS